MSEPASQNGDTSHGPLKRKAVNVSGHGRTKIPRRNQVKPIKPERERFWDTYCPSPMLKEEIRRNFIHAAKRSSELKRYKLLYEYEKIRSTEIRLLHINPAKDREMDLFVSLGTIADTEVGQDPLQEYEALSYHWGPGPADRPVYLFGSKSLPRFSISALAQL